MKNTEQTKTIGVEEINDILSDTLRQVSDRSISPKRAQAISRIALALSKNIANVDLKKRLELVEQILENRK